MLNIDSRRFGEDLVTMRVTDNGRDIWTFEVEDSWSGCGAGRTHVWVGDLDGTINIYDAAARRQSGKVHIPRGMAWRSMSVSRDGLQLYVFEPIEQDQTSTLHVIDLAAGQITVRHPGIPGLVAGFPTERADGWLLLTAVRRPGIAGITIVTIDPLKGTRTIDVLGGGPRRDRVLPSPDGRYLLRRDLSQLPRKTVGATPRGLLGFGRKRASDGEVYFGLAWQVWEASPLRFVRSIVTQWMKPEELRESFRFDRRLPPAEAAACRLALWDSIAAAMRRANLPPDGDLPSRTDFDTPFADSEESWRLLQDTLETFAAHDTVSVFKGWQPDGAAFWLDSNGYRTCVGLDGTTSPRLYLERLGFDPDTWPRCTYGGMVVPLPERQAELRFDAGIAIISGIPSPEIVHAIPPSSDRWRAISRPLPDSRGNRLVIPLPDWTQDAVNQAIELLTAEITPALAGRASEWEIQILFEQRAETVAEAAFFDRVAADFPEASAPLRALVTRFVESVLHSKFLFSDAENGHGLLSHAVLALGLLDADALPVVQAYGRVVDREHEYDFAGQIVPRLIAEHGWTDAMIDFRILGVDPQLLQQPARLQRGMAGLGHARCACRHRSGSDGAACRRREPAGPPFGQVRGGKAQGRTRSTRG